MSTLLQQPIQRKLSALLGADVTFDKLNVSLIGGVIEAAGVTITGADKSLPPILTIGRVRAQVAITRALKGEFVVRSLTIEKPVVRFVQRNGVNNVPARDVSPGEVSRTVDAPKVDEKADKSSWKFDVEKILLVDGEAHAQIDDRAYAMTAFLAELKRVGDGYDATAMSDAVSLINTLRASARITGASDLTKIAEAAIDAELQLGDLGKVNFKSPRIRNLDDGELSLRAGLTIARLRSLLKQARA